MRRYKALAVRQRVGHEPPALDALGPSRPTTLQGSPAKPDEAFLIIGKVGGIHDKTADKHASNEGEQVKSNHNYQLRGPPVIKARVHLFIFVE